MRSNSILETFDFERKILISLGKINCEFKPKRGKAIVWNNLLPNGNGNAWYLNNDGSNAFYLNYNGTDVLTASTSGNVGVGVTPSAWTLKSLQIVAGGIYGSGNETGYYANAFYGSSGWRYINAAGASGYLQNGGSHQWYRSTSANVAGTDPVFSQAMTLDASGRLLVGPTSANTSGGVLQLKSGITFPATQVASSDANTLDDYEEGTFTATLTGGTSNPTTPVTTTARYTKVGRLVTVQIEFVNISNAGASGAIAITGLPFVNGSVAATGIATLYNLATFTGSPVVYLDTSVSALAFYGNVSSSAFSSVTHNSTTSGYSTTTITYSV